MSVPPDRFVGFGEGIAAAGLGMAPAGGCSGAAGGDACALTGTRLVKNIMETIRQNNFLGKYLSAKVMLIKNRRFHYIYLIILKISCSSCKLTNGTA